MNKTIISRIILLMLLFAGTVSAQETNKIYIGDLRGMKSSTFDMPINVDNTNNNIVAAQMEVRVPYGLTLNTSVTTLNDQRIDGHRLRSTLVSSASSEGQQGSALQRTGCGQCFGIVCRRAQLSHLP